MSFSISNTSASAVITTLSTPSSATGDVTITGGTLPLFVGGLISGSNTEINNTKGSPYGSILMLLQQGDAKIDTYVNNTLYSTDTYGSGLISVQTPILQSGDSLTMAVSDPQFDCYDLTPNFSGASTNVSATDIIEQPDGKFIFAGTFQTYKGESYNKIIRLNTDFSIDTSFVIGAGFNTGASVNAIALQSDGKILCGGTFTGYSGTSIARIIRLNSDGSRDTTFQSGTGATGTINSILVQPDNKILVGGAITQYSGVSLSGITRLNIDGSIDPSFTCSLSSVSMAAMALQSNGKIVITGGFTTVNATSINRIARLETNGSTDATFSAGTGFNLAGTAVNVESDGKIMVVGSFSGYNGNASSRIIRLNSDGSIDNTFVVGTGVTAGGGLPNILSISKRNNRYVATGTFSEYQGITEGMIIGLNNDGSIDSTFNTGTGFTFSANASPHNLIKSNGEIIVIGRDLATYRGESVTNLVVLNPFGELLNC